MATLQPVLKFTWQDYCATPDDERYELLDGDLLLTPAPNLKHQRAQRRLGRRLDQFIEERELGEIFYAPFDVVLSDTDVVQPDLLFVSRRREHLLSNGANVQGAPDLVIEILSPSTANRDLGYKRTLYARHGVLEYWIVDPVEETVRVLCPRDGALEVAHTFSRGQTLRSPLLDGFTVDVDDIFR